MPIYEYECTACGKHADVIQKISDQPLAECPECGGEFRKLMSSTSFVLKGGGWYADGYASSANSDGASSADSKVAEASKSSKSPSGSAEASKPSTSSSGSKETKPAKKESAASSA